MFKSLAISFGSNALASVLGSVAVILVIASLSPHGWGVAAAVLGAGQFTGALLSFGSQTERVRRYSRMPRPEMLAAARADSTSRLIVVLALGVLVVVTAFVSFEVAGALMAAAGVFASLGATNHLIASKRYFAAGGLQILEKSLALGAVIALIGFGGMTPLLLAPLMGASGVLAAVVSYVALRPNHGSVRDGMRLERISGIWRNSFFLGIASVMPSALLLDVTIVLAFSDATSAGLFAVATKVTAPLSIVASAVVAVMLPILAASTERRLRAPRGREVAGLGLVGLGLAVVFVSADLWVPFVFGAEYAGAAWPVRLYVLNVAVVLLTRALMTVLQAWDDERYASFLVSGQVALALVGLAVGASLGGAVGASLSALVTNVGLGVLLLLRVRRLAGRQQ
jgi:O-antigen/teichoic acid export membrane protein